VDTFEITGAIDRKSLPENLIKVRSDSELQEGEEQVHRTY